MILSDFIKKLPSNMQNIVVAFLCGFMFATLLCVNLKYPFYHENTKTFSDVCATSPVKMYYIGISGHIYKVICENGREISLK